MPNLVTVDFKVEYKGGKGEDSTGVYRVQGANYFYGNGDVQAAIGADKTDEGDLRRKGVIKKKVEYQRRLVPMVAKLKADSVVQNAAQTTKTRQFKFWCHPGSVLDAMIHLPGVDIDESLLPGKWQIEDVFVPVDSNLA